MHFVSIVPKSLEAFNDGWRIDASKEILAAG